MIYWIIGGVCWMICGILAYGIALALQQRGFPSIAKRGYREDCSFATFVGFMGLIGLIAVFICSGFAEHGLMYRTPH